jgi:hypothetical protein
MPVCFPATEGDRTRLRHINDCPAVRHNVSALSTLLPALRNFR